MAGEGGFVNEVDGGRNCGEPRLKVETGGFVSRKKTDGKGGQWVEKALEAVAVGIIKSKAQSRVRKTSSI